MPEPRDPHCRWIASLPEILRELRVSLDGSTSILDFGCGSGDVVAGLRQSGFDAYGVDVRKFLGHNVEVWSGSELAGSGFLRAIEENLYRIPFPDATFDVIVSNQVFEHIHDYGTAISEIRRVLTPTGATFHVFPPKWRLIEGHVMVPLAGAIQCPAYLNFWAWLGVRNSFQKGLGWRETASRNIEYLRAGTNYLSRGEIHRHFAEYFEEVYFVESVYWRHVCKRLKHLTSLAARLPLGAYLLGALRERAVFCRKPRQSALSRNAAPRHPKG